MYIRSASSPSTVLWAFHTIYSHLVNIWNSLPNHVVDVNSVNVFKARLDRFWMDQDVKFDFTADLTGIADRSVNVITET